MLAKSFPKVSLESRLSVTMLYKIVNGLAPPNLECYVTKRSAMISTATIY